MVVVGVAAERMAIWVAHNELRVVGGVHIMSNIEMGVGIEV